MGIDDSTSSNFVEKSNKDETKYYFLTTLGKEPNIKHAKRKMVLPISIHRSYMKM